MHLGFGSIVFAAATASAGVLRSSSSSSSSPGAEADSFKLRARQDIPPCQRVTQASNAGAITVAPSLALECLHSVPLDVQRSAALIDYAYPLVSFQSNLAFIKSPPAEYKSSAGADGVDILGKLQEMKSKVNARGYKSQYEFTTELDQLIRLGNDGHFTFSPLLNKVFRFGREAFITSISKDGVSLPQIYDVADFKRSLNGSYEPSPILTIDGVPIYQYLSDLGKSLGVMHDLDASVNMLLPSKAKQATGLENPGYFKAGAYFSLPDNSTFELANGTKLVFENVALLRYNFSQNNIRTGADLHAKVDLYPQGMMGRRDEPSSLVPRQFPFPWAPPAPPAAPAPWMPPAPPTPQAPWVPPARPAPSAPPAPWVPPARPGPSTLPVPPAPWVPPARPGPSTSPTPWLPPARPGPSTTPIPPRPLASPRCTVAHGYLPRPAEWPKPIDEHVDKYVGGFFLTGQNYSDVAVLEINSFVTLYDAASETDECAVENIVEFHRFMGSFVTKFRQSGKKRLVIDLSNNGGGWGATQVDAFEQLFPGKVPGFMFRARATTSLGWMTNATYAGQAAEPIGAAVIDDLHKGWPSSFGPEQVGGDNFTRKVFHDIKAERDGLGIGNTVFQDQLVSPENIIAVTDGDCSSSCSMFLGWLTRNMGVRAIVMGGRPTEGPVQAIGGTKGGVTVPWDMYQAVTQLALEIRRIPPPGPQGLGLPPLTYMPLRVASNQLNTMDIWRDGAAVPLQFEYEAAHCRLFYNPKTSLNIEEMWKAVADVAWGGAKCAAGSTVNADGTIGKTAPAFRQVALKTPTSRAVKGRGVHADVRVMKSGPKENWRNVVVHEDRGFGGWKFLASEKLKEKAGKFAKGPKLEDS